MREILFRAKRIDNGDWVTGYPNDCEGRLFIVGSLVEANEEYDALEWWQPVDPATLGQYTGLTDKNGVKIFEGDTLRCWRSVGSKGQLRGEYYIPLDVKYCEMWGSFVLDDAPCKTFFHLNIFDAMEVISTIHDQQED